MSNRLLIIAIASSISACTAPGVKPDDANLFEAATNISSGEFDNQLSRKRLELKSSQDAVNRENAKSQNLNKELNSVTAQKQALDKQLNTLQIQNNQLLQQANKTRAKNSIQQAKRNQQIEKIKQLNSSISNFKRKQHKVSSSSNIEYKSKVSSLKQEISVLRQMISNQ